MRIWWRDLRKSAVHVDSVLVLWRCEMISKDVSQELVFDSQFYLTLPTSSLCAAEKSASVTITATSSGVAR